MIFRKLCVYLQPYMTYWLHSYVTLVKQIQLKYTLHSKSTSKASCYSDVIKSGPSCDLQIIIISILEFFKELDYFVKLERNQNTLQK